MFEITSPQEYADLAARTEVSPGALLDNLAVEETLQGESGHCAVTAQKIRLLHGILGLHTESGELATAIKAHLFYGKPLDLVNLQEEVGDAMWYVPMIVDAVNQLAELQGRPNLIKTLGEVLGQNIEKLRARFPAKFTEEAAQTRNLEKERRVLESPVAHPWFRKLLVYIGPTTGAAVTGNFYIVGQDEQTHYVLYRLYGTPTRSNLERRLTQGIARKDPTNITVSEDELARYFRAVEPFDTRKENP